MEDVKNGMLLSEAIRASGSFDKKLAAVIVTGEEAGCLEDMLKGWRKIMNMRRIWHSRN